MNEFEISKIKLIIGLGNNGKEYENTRHNVGFQFLDQFTTKSGFLEEKKLKALINIATINNSKIILAKPTTLMNLSGESVIAILNYYKLNPDELLVVHDDLDIVIGEFKMQFQKGPKIHNGVNSIENRLGTDKFWRLRIGVDNRDSETRKLMSGADYVLGRFKEAEKEIIQTTFEDIVERYF